MTMDKTDTTTLAREADIELRNRAVRDEAVRALEIIRDDTAGDRENNHRADDREGCLDGVHALANNALTYIGKLEAALSHPSGEPERREAGEVLDARAKLTPEYLAMTPLQKWETLTLHGLLGTDEPWIEDMRQTLRALSTPPSDGTGEGVTEAKDYRLNLARALFESAYGMTLCGWSDQTRDHWLMRADQALSALRSKPEREPDAETLETIAEWCEATFGPVDLPRIAERANEEMQELLAEPSKVEEAADVLIVLSRYPDLWKAVERKMKINRARKWRLMGDGTGYHIPAALTQSGGEQ